MARKPKYHSWGQVLNKVQQNRAQAKIQTGAYASTSITGRPGGISGMTTGEISPALSQMNDLIPFTILVKPSDAKPFQQLMTHEFGCEQIGGLTFTLPNSDTNS